MTRFARAKGSKASNERVPEEATSWSEMKEQLVEKNKEAEVSKKKKEADKQRANNYKAFLENIEEEKTKSTKWAEFPTKKSEIGAAKVIEKKQKNKRNFQVVEEGISVENKIHCNNASNIEETSDKKKKKKKGKTLVELSSGTDSNFNPDNNNEGGTTEISMKKKNKKKNLGEQGFEAKKINLKTAVNDVNSIEKKNIAQKGGVKRKLKAVDGKTKKVKKSEEDLTEEDRKKLEKKKQKRLRQLEKKKLKQQQNDSQMEANEKADEFDRNKWTPKVRDNQKPDVKQKTPKIKDSQIEASEKADQSQFDHNKWTPKLRNSQKPGIKKKTPKIKDNNQHERRKKPQDRMIINGKEVEISYVDGFPIKKEDAERIQQLRKQMISKGLPRSEIKIALKLERRKAEKAFAREKKKVCFNCRKSGHNLSECPDLGKELVDASGTGICFKCGSTEHTHFECKVVRGQEFKFAQCFICHEQGHIARQCPDNARGLYPKGGACKVCGDVTHLKKDCPKYQAQQQQLEQNLQIDTISSNDNPDSLPKNEENVQVRETKRPNKIIKF